ncbi:MAG: sigma-70 family RNA polymerase sigma factor, partial [Clostridiales bacterium]|nr:sigma-70 family RNA polymerase sigma factor [Clostridiales bacterium]
MSSDEKILLRRAIDGDIECFEQLIEKYQTKAYNIAFRILGNEEDAKDATQDAFIKIYHALGSFRGDSSFYTWVYRIVTNTCYDFLKKRNKLY